MNFKYISPEVMAEFISTYPSAYSFLLHHSLHCELAALHHEFTTGGFFPSGRINYLKSRIAELELLLSVPSLS
jgi:hypothetical protein